MVLTLSILIRIYTEAEKQKSNKINTKQYFSFTEAETYSDWIDFIKLALQFLIRHAQVSLLEIISESEVNLVKHQ